MKFDKPDDQLIFLSQIFGLSVQKNKLMNRCVKCNNDKIIDLDPAEAKKILKWKEYDDLREYPEVTEFWICTKCKQIYWEGASYNNAKKRFREFVDDHMGGEGSDSEWED